MSGKEKGVASLILKENPLAIYVHCYAHKLNLAIQSSMNIPELTLVITQMGKIINFFNSSPNRSRLLSTVIERDETQPIRRKKILISFCATRWSQRDETFQHFQGSYLYIVKALRIILNLLKSPIDRLAFDANTMADALNFLNTLESSSFNIGFHTILKYFSPLAAPTADLQGKAQDILSAHMGMKSVIHDFENIRKNVNSSFNQVWNHSSRLADALGVELDKPRVSKKSVYRSNVGHADDSPEVYYRNSLCIPLLDKIINQLNSRFTNPDSVSKFLYMIPALMITKTFEETKEMVTDLGEKYSADIQNTFLLEAEVEIFYNSLAVWPEESIPTTIAATLKAIDDKKFPNLYTLMKICGTLPVSSCECERSFSCMRRLKTWQRASMCDDRFSNLALMNIHREVLENLEPTKVLKAFIESNPRKIELNIIKRFRVIFILMC
jgi:hypothetical protein